ncbi:MAG TPA: sigma-70 family RNA polymerase sigma factor [Pirellulales bacterium]|nr:sigma-70 family RNA polymerase sigma factor [Pirellulales bacterium]
MSRHRDAPEILLVRARAGEREALDRLLGLYRNYLRLLARTQIKVVLRGRLDPSDLVQEVLANAFERFDQFKGATEGELTQWLRKILVRQLADQVKGHQSQKRDVRRELSLDALDRSVVEAEGILVSRLSSPSSQAARRERSVLLADALEQLPADYREVIILRHLERVEFSEIARRMGRSAGAVRMLWVRALEKLRAVLE